VTCVPHPTSALAQEAASLLTRVQGARSTTQELRSGTLLSKRKRSTFPNVLLCI
jgi:hypothetical protein